MLALRTVRAATAIAPIRSSFVPLARFYSEKGVPLGTVSDAIKHDHKELATYYENIINAPDADAKVRWQNQFVWELAR